MNHPLFHGASPAGKSRVYNGRASEFIAFRSDDQTAVQTKIETPSEKAIGYVDSSVRTDNISTVSSFYFHACNG